MTKEQLFKWVDTGRELELSYKGKNYSIIYPEIDNKRIISFCQFDDEVLDVTTVNELWNSTYKEIKLSDMLSSIPEDKVDVF